MKRNRYQSVHDLQREGFAHDDAVRLRKDALILHRWHELECGSTYGCVERDETTGKTYSVNAMSGRRYPCADRETPALKRIASVMSRYPGFSAYIQGDPRGCSLYILRPGDVPEGCKAKSYYNRGIAVY